MYYFNDTKFAMLPPCETVVEEALEQSQPGNYISN